MMQGVDLFWRHREVRLYCEHGVRCQRTVVRAATDSRTRPAEDPQRCSLRDRSDAPFQPVQRRAPAAPDGADDARPPGPFTSNRADADRSERDAEQLSRRTYVLKFVGQVLLTRRQYVADPMAVRSILTGSVRTDRSDYVRCATEHDAGKQHRTADNQATQVAGRSGESSDALVCVGPLCSLFVKLGRDEKRKPSDERVRGLAVVHACPVEVDAAGLVSIPPQASHDVERCVGAAPGSREQAAGRQAEH
jgi:hypothetical protein